MFDRFLGDDSGKDVDLDAVKTDADERLRDRVTPAVYDIDDCGVTGLAVVNEGPEGEPVTVPVATVSLGSDPESVDFDRVWTLVDETLRAIFPAFADVYVRHYDVRFTFGGGLLSSEECRRVAVPPELAERLATEAGWSREQLRAAVVDGHDIDDEVAPVAWGTCVDYNRDRGTGGAAGAAAGGF